MGAIVDTNFLAGNNFVIKNDGLGTSVTWQVQATQSGGNYTGWGTVSNEVSSGDRVLTNVKSVSPTFGDGNDLVNWGEFWAKNPFHVSKLNLRASKSSVLPTQIIVLTPNVFSGQYDRQIIDVSANKSAYQYQSDIITIDVDLFIGRNSIIKFNGSFTEATEPSLFVDITITKYISLEKGLVENVNLIKTDAGASQLVTDTITVESVKNDNADVNMISTANAANAVPSGYVNIGGTLVQLKNSR